MEEKNIIKELEDLSEGIKRSHFENGVELNLIELIEERHFDHTTVFENEIAIVNFNGIKALSLGNFSVISGKPKAGKGFSLSLIIDGFLNGNDVFNGNVTDRKKVIHIDTEQSGGHAQRLTNTVGKLGGNNDLIEGYWFRGVTPEPLIKIVDILIEKHHDEASIFIIDGIRDLSQKGVNDQEESTKLFNKLLHWTQKYNIHIIVVIHQNKADNNATGFLGGDMVKKAELHLTVKKNKAELTHTIEAEDTRDAPIGAVHFMLDNDIKPEFVDAPTQSTKKTRPEQYELNTHKAFIKDAYKDGKVKTRSELIDKIQFAFNVGNNKARIFIEHFTNAKLIKETGPKNRKSYVLYNDEKLF